MLEQLKKTLITAHLLSLDVVMGAVICHIAFLKLPNGYEKVNPFSVSLLALAVFLIYTIDRLLDIKKTPKPTTSQHLFHEGNQVVLTRCCLVVVLLGIILCFFIPKNLCWIGGGIAVLSMLYLLAVWKLPVRNIFYRTKSVFTALIYTLGVGVTAIFPQGANLTNGILVGMLFLVAIQNLKLFRWYASFLNNAEATYNPLFLKITWLLLLGCITVLIVADFPYQRRFACILLLMSVSLFGVFYASSFFEQKQRYRWVIDAVFFWALVLIC